MQTHTWHASAAVFLSLLCLFCCGTGSATLAIAAFLFSLWHAFSLLWALRPNQERARWAVELHTPKGRLAVAWVGI